MPSLTLHLKEESDTLKLGARLARALSHTGLLYLSGELGSGKTTLVRGFLSALGHVGPVKSPTFTLVESYELLAHRIHHFDLYRVKDVHELEAIGIRDYFSEVSIRLIEWPEKMKSFGPPPDIVCHLEIDGTGRKAAISAETPAGQAILEKLGTPS